MIFSGFQALFLLNTQVHGTSSLLADLRAVSKLAFASPYAFLARSYSFFLISTFLRSSLTSELCSTAKAVEETKN